MSKWEKRLILFCAVAFAAAMFAQIQTMNGYLREIAEALKKISGMNF